MAKPPESSKPPTTPPLPMQDELKKIIQYIAQVYKLLKETDAKVKALDKRISDLEKSVGTIVTKSVVQLKASLMKTMEKDVQTAIEKSITPLKTDLMKTMEKDVQTAIEKSITPLKTDLINSLSKHVQTIITKEVLPKLAATAAKHAPEPAPTPKATPAPEPKPTPTPAPKEPEPAPAAETTAEVRAPPSPPPRAPSDIPDPRISTVVDELENIVKELKGRQKVQREFLRPLLEQARDVAMNNLASRAVAARTFKEIINIVKNSPFDVPRDVIETIVTKLEELSLHIRT